MEVNNVNTTAISAVSRAREDRLHTAPELTRAVKVVNGAKLFGQDSELSFAVDRATRRLVIRLVDKDTRRVIRQIPSEYVLSAAEDLLKP